MSDIPVNPNDPIEEPILTTGEGIAERYVDKELVESHASLRRTQIIGALLAVFTIGYMAYLTSNFRASMKPTAAANIATGLATQRLDDLEPQFSEYIHDKVPKLIRKAPDEVIARMPEYRKELESRVEKALREQAEKGSAELDKQLDTFLTEHKEEVGQLLEDGQDPAKLEKIGTELEANFQTFLTETKIGNETLQQKMDSALSTLKEVSVRTAKLADNKGLNPSEKNARKAVAMLMRRISVAKKAEPNAIPTIDRATLQKNAEELKDRALNTLEKARETVKANVPESANATPLKTTSPTPMTKPAPKKP